MLRDRAVGPLPTFAAPLLLLAGCVGDDNGGPAAPYSLAPSTIDATIGDVEASASPPPNVALTGTVRLASTGAGVAGAVVIVEVGGLGQRNPSIGGDGGAQASVLVDPYIRFGAITDDTGAFRFSSVPAGATGLYGLEPLYGQLTAHTTPSPSAGDASQPPVEFSLLPLDLDGGAPPALTGLTATPSLVAPLTDITFTVEVAAGSPADPLSDEVFLVEPSSGWAGALVPPTPAVAGGPYPNGVYNRVARSPSNPGVYTYTAVAVSTQGEVSPLATVVVTVTASGSPPIPDASFYDGEVFPESGLPDGRR